MKALIAIVLVVLVQPGAVFAESSRERINYQLDLGSRFVLWQGPVGDHLPEGDGWRVSLEAEGRFMFQSLPPDESAWLMDASAFISDMTLRARLLESDDGAAVGIFFRNDCKHDMDRSSRRLVFQDAFGVEATSPVWQGRYGGSSPAGDGPEWAAWLSARAEWATNLIFEPKGSPEPYRGGIYTQLDAEPLIFPSGLAVFSTLRAGLRINQDPFTNDELYTDIDLVARLGVRTPRRDGHIAFFGELHRLSDDWIDDSMIGAGTEPLHMLSVGVQIAVGR